MPKDKRSFFERLTGTVKIDHDDDFDMEEHVHRMPETKAPPTHARNENEWVEEQAEEGQLTVDVFQTPNDIIIKTIVAGVKPDDLDIQISRDMVTIKGHRDESREVSDEDYFHKELYWGAFSRTILLPEEIDTEEAEAITAHGLLTIRLPKVDKRRQTKLKVKTSNP